MMRTITSDQACDKSINKWWRDGNDDNDDYLLMWSSDDNYTDSENDFFHFVFNSSITLQGNLLNFVTVTGRVYEMKLDV